MGPLWRAGAFPPSAPKADVAVRDPCRVSERGFDACLAVLEDHLTFFKEYTGDDQSPRLLSRNSLGEGISTWTPTPIRC